MPPTQVAEEGLSRLGSGGEEDKLGFRLIVATLWRCVPLLKPVGWHVVVLAILYAAIGMILFPLVLVLFDLFWTRALQGQPLTLETAASFDLDPAIAVHVVELSPAVRREVAQKNAKTNSPSIRAAFRLI